MSSKTGTLKSRPTSKLSVTPPPAGSSSSGGGGGMNTLRAKQSMNTAIAGGAVNMGDNMRTTFSKSDIFDYDNADNSTITCESVSRTLTRFYLYKIIIEKVIYVLFWPAMVILMYVSLAYFQDSDNNFFVVDGISNAFCGDEWEFEFSRISSIVNDKNKNHLKQTNKQTNKNHLKQK